MSDILCGAMSESGTLGLLTFSHLVGDLGPMPDHYVIQEMPPHVQDESSEVWVDLSACELKGSQIIRNGDEVFINLDEDDSLQGCRVLRRRSESFVSLPCSPWWDHKPLGRFIADCETITCGELVRRVKDFCSNAWMKAWMPHFVGALEFD